MIFDARSSGTTTFDARLFHCVQEPIDFTVTTISRALTRVRKFDRRRSSLSYDFYPFAFPNNQDCPASGFEPVNGIRVRRSRFPTDFRLPIGCIRFWYACATWAGVAMPEATVNENSFTLLEEDQIVTPRQIAAM